MKKQKIAVIAVLFTIIMSTLLLTGCSTHSSKSFTYKVTTGDKIEIKMDTTGGYNLTSELPIKFSKDDETISQGSFGKEQAYDTYLNIIENEDGNAELIEKKERKDVEYIFYKYNNEYDYIIKIKDSSTCFILANNDSEDSARDIFDRLKFEVK